MTVHDFYKGLLNFIHGGAHNVLAGVTYLAHAIESNGGDVLFAAALAGVAAAETQGGTGTEKLQHAQQAVLATLAAKGIPAVMNAVNGAIEAAVAQHKANLAA